jgi:segregation and condensation protein A
MIRYLHRALTESPRGEPVAARQLFERQRSRRAMICLFLAILELVKRQALVLVQKEAFGEIALRRHKRFEEIFATDETLAAIEQEYSK